LARTTTRNSLPEGRAIISTDPSQAPTEDLLEEPGAEAETRPFVIAAALHGERLDRALAHLVPEFSRSYLQQLVAQGAVRLRGAVLTKPSYRVRAGEPGEIELRPTPQSQAFLPEDLPLAVVHEDEHLLVVDKPAGLVVHPAPGNWNGTLLNALLGRDPAARMLPRAGIVHRLDKDTSGLMVVAKNLTAQANLAAQLADRSVKRTYLALVHGAPPAQGEIDAPVGRDTRVRTRMTVTHRGKEARTRYRVLERLGKFALVECRLETGRTHQIRVHLQHIGHPLLGDPVYRRGARSNVDFPRQALHAAELELVHPRTGRGKDWKAPLPADMKKLLAALRRECGHDSA
jgi:23S rRNA pseudouridine1911/1915/1917 synthase